MAKRSIHVLAGIALILSGSYFILMAGHSLHLMWRREAAAKLTEKENLPPKADDVTEAARVTVYGVLAPPADTAADNEAPSRRAGGPVSAADHVHASPVSGTHRLVRSRLSLGSYRGFSFVVPAHAIHPKIEGTFKSRNRETEGNPANVDVMLLTPQEFEDLVHHTEGTASFFAGGPDGSIAWTVRPTFSEPQKYYLVFRNASGSSVAELVDVDFKINFD